MLLKSQRPHPMRIHLRSKITSIFQQFYASQGGAEAHVKRTPILAFPERGAEPFCGIAKKPYFRDPGKATALPQDKVGMQVTNHCLLDLGKL